MISIILPALNEERYLPALLEDIKKQSFKDYEVLVADANSKDRTRQIAKTYGCRIVKGGMPAVGRNNGAKAAKGNILLFLDADVHIGNDFLKNATEEFAKRKLDVAGFRLRASGNNIIDRLFFTVFNFWTLSTQFFYPNAAGAGIMCKRELHKKVNGFDETIKLSEDMDFAKRCGKIGKFRILRKPELYVAMRRFERDGRFKVALKLVLSAFHRLFLGEIRSDVFKYELKYRK
ncbi:glycosyltransferase [Candidatus Woesearchaeota archaeon]|nr:glycosyltransferase [Candidatus Woesearchaeota archaeon]